MFFNSNNPVIISNTGNRKALKLSYELPESCLDLFLFIEYMKVSLKTMKALMEPLHYKTILAAGKVLATV